MSVPPITFVVPVSSKALLAGNFLASPCLRTASGVEIVIQENFRSAAKAYNEAIDRSVNDLIVFAHQDVYFPERWLLQLGAALEQLEERDPQWGVLGCWGATENGQYVGHIYSTGLGVLGSAFGAPSRVQTLDEVVLILRKSSCLRFDECLTGFHFYGTDICMAALKQRRTCYAISAFCIHNTHQLLILPSEFYEGYRKVRDLWRDYLPIHTTCVRISRLGMGVHLRRLREFSLRMLGRHQKGAGRVSEPRQIVQELEAHNEV